MSLISFIVPVYNLKKEELSSCLASIVTQTVSRNSYELIIVDDGSNNGIETFCDVLGKKYHAVVIHQSNQGLAVARNTGIKASSGDWIVHVDGDDWVSEDLAESLLRAVENKDVDIVVWGYFIANGTTRQELLLKNKTAFDQKYSLIRERLLCSVLDNDSSFKSLALNTSWGKAYSRKFINREQLYYNPSLRRAQDAVYNLYAFYFATRVLYVDKALNYYRNDNPSLSRGFNPKTFQYLQLTALAVQDFVLGNSVSQMVSESAVVFIKRCFRMINSQYYQHKDNPQSYHTRKRLFLEGINTEPFLSAFSTGICSEGFYNKLTDILFRKRMFGGIELFNHLSNCALSAKRKIKSFKCG